MAVKPLDWLAAGVGGGAGVKAGGAGAGSNVGAGANAGAGTGAAAGVCAAGVPPSDWNIAVKPPGWPGCAAGGAAIGSGEKSGDDATGAGVATGGAAAAGSAGFLVSCASRSSSSFAGEAEGIPKMPVALDGVPPEGSSDWGEKSLPKRSLNASMQVHHVSEKIALFRNPRLHRLGLTVKSGQPTMQAHSMAARSGQVIAA
jgi:hypothetical protein